MKKFLSLVFLDTVWTRFDKLPEWARLICVIIMACGVIIFISNRSIFHCWQWQTVGWISVYLVFTRLINNDTP